MASKNLSENPNPGSADLQDEKTIITHLEQFRPTPSRRFYQRMAAAPWNAAQSHPRNTSQPWWRRPVFAAPLLLAIILLMLTVFSPPSLRATAQRVAEFFIRLPGNETSVEITPGTDGQLDYIFDQTVAEAEEAAGFLVYVPESVPDRLQFNGAKFVPDRDTVFLDYRTADSRQILRISIQQLDGRETYASIGENAEVESVQIGGNAGEYVVGGWTLPVVATPLEAAAPGVKITLEGQTQILRWQENDLLFEIMSVTAPSAKDFALTKEELISLAEDMQ